MWQQFVRDYFTFTRKERSGILVLLAIIALLWLLPEFFGSSNKELTPREIQEFKAEVAKLNQVRTNDDTSYRRGYRHKRDETFRYSENSYKNSKAELFEFDPNTLSASGWQRLGVREKTILTIQNYLAKGGHFYQPEDISKIYGLQKKEYERMLPYVKIQPDNLRVRTKPGYADSSSKLPERPMVNKFSSSHSMVDINSADSALLIMLPGIGSKLAARIISFRDKLGGFHDAVQVAETYGLPDSVFQKIRFRLIIMPDFIPATLNINGADVKLLQAHPYISFAVANAIVQYRSQHGLFTSINELEKIALITPELLNRIKPYLSI